MDMTTRKSPRRTLPALGLALASVVVFAGCGQQTSGSADTAPSPPPPSSSEPAGSESNASPANPTGKKPSRRPSPVDAELVLENDLAPVLGGVDSMPGGTVLESPRDVERYATSFPANGAGRDVRALVGKVDFGERALVAFAMNSGCTSLTPLGIAHTPSGFELVADKGLTTKECFRAYEYLFVYSVPAETV